MIPEFPFDPAVLAGAGDLFPTNISDDPWIAYHGTSFLNAALIERDGLRTDVIDAELFDAARRIVGIYERLGWSGEDLGGFGVLIKWSLDSDISEHQQRYVTFAESSYRAAFYARRDYAGGEMMRALRKSITHLRQYHDDPAMRERHFKDVLGQRAHRVARRAVDVPEVPAADLRWLAEELARLASVYGRICAPETNHLGGVVYAVRFHEGDLPNLIATPTMGLRSSVPVSADRLVARVVLPEGVHRPWPWPQDRRRLECAMNPRGVWARTSVGNRA